MALTIASYKSIVALFGFSAENITLKSALALASISCIPLTSGSAAAYLHADIHTSRRNT